MPKTIGYSRVSTDGQTLDAQNEALKAAGCEKVYSEKASGAKSDRAALAKAISSLEAGDVLVVTRLDRLARSKGQTAYCSIKLLRYDHFNPPLRCRKAVAALRCPPPASK